MRTDSLKLALKKSPRSRRTWHTHASKRNATEEVYRDLPPADVIDEAIAAFERVNTAARSQMTAHAAHEPHSKKASLAATLATQLEALDRQREQLARLLHTIDDTSIDS